MFPRILAQNNIHYEGHRNKRLSKCKQPFTSLKKQQPLSTNDVASIPDSHLAYLRPLNEDLGRKPTALSVYNHLANQDGLPIAQLLNLVSFYAHSTHEKAHLVQDLCGEFSKVVSVETPKLYRQACHVLVTCGKWDESMQSNLHTPLDAWKLFCVNSYPTIAISLDNILHSALFRMPSVLASRHSMKLETSRNVRKRTSLPD
ncbi:hypothetical protein K439DRAFT_690473 [Ramaria rubella]|nr:hypothetical protein K439DRAFT_690473 [Ramaria rubella]